METQQEKANAFIAAALVKFRAGPLYFEAVRDGWNGPLDNYAIAVATYQAHLITRKHPSEPLVGFDVDAVFGEGFNRNLDAGHAGAAYIYTQWQREMHRDCCHGSIAILIPGDHYKALQALAIEQQNIAASTSTTIE